MSFENSPSLSPENDALDIQRKELETGIKSSANWFYWITALSAINGVIILAGGKWHFLIGLGIIDLSASLSAGTALLNFIQVGFLFTFLGFCARKLDAWAFAAGMGFYVLDCVLVIAVQDWLSLVFHIIVVVFLSRGLSANLSYNKFYPNGSTTAAVNDRAGRKIRGAFLAAVVTGSVALITFLTGSFDSGWMGIFDSFILIALGIGIYKRNRACAVILLVYWIGSTIVTQLAGGINAASLIGGLFSLMLWGLFFVLGIWGTFTYRKLAATESINN